MNLNYIIKSEKIFSIDRIQINQNCMQIGYKISEMWHLSLHHVLFSLELSVLPKNVFSEILSTKYSSVNNFVTMLWKYS